MSRLINPTYTCGTAHQTQNEQDNQPQQLDCKAEIENAATTEQATGELHSESGDTGNLHVDIHSLAEQPSLELGREKQPAYSVLARRFTFEDGTLLQNVPPSEDPEVFGFGEEEDDHECELVVKRPPTIYSSQILLFAEGPENENETRDLPPQDNTSAASRILQPQKEVHSPDYEEPSYMEISIPMDVEIFHNEDRQLDIKPVPEKPPEPLSKEEHVPTELDKESTKIHSFPEEEIVEMFLSHESGDLMSSTSRRKQQVETGKEYDIPLVVDTKSSTKRVSDGEEDGNMCGLFGDPKYMEVTPTNVGRDEAESSMVDVHTLHGSAEKDALQPETENEEDTLPSVAQHPKNKFEMQGRRNIDPLALIDLQEEEMADLDPDIAAFLTSSSDH